MWKRRLPSAHAGRPGRPRPSRRLRPVAFTGPELLDRRVLPAVTATFSAAAGILRVIGDELDNTIVVSRDAAGAILVNDGAIAIQGDRPATVSDVHEIFLVGGGGDDHLSVDETSGVMPSASLFGGDGNDVLTGGSGDDFFDGGPGNDIAFMGAGDDTIQWNPGDGSDTVDGQGGHDMLMFNGSDASETFDLSADGTGVRLTRDVGGVAMELDGIEEADLNAFGGADTITLNDTSATALSEVDLDLNGSHAGGDGRPDSVVVNGTNGDDHIRIVPAGSGDIVTVAGLSASVNIKGEEATNDHLTVHALGGDDVLDASSLPLGLIGLTLDGGTGCDLILGSPGNGHASGGDGGVSNPGGSDQLTTDDVDENESPSDEAGHGSAPSDTGNAPAGSPTSEAGGGGTQPLAQNHPSGVHRVRHRGGTGGRGESDHHPLGLQPGRVSHGQGHVRRHLGRRTG